MNSSETIITALAQAYQSLDLSLARTGSICTAFAQTYQADRFPSQVELAPLLTSFQQSALALADFLDGLAAVINDQEVCQAIRALPPQARGIGPIEPAGLLGFFWTLNGLNDQLRRPGQPAPDFWEAALGLALYYGYYTSRLISDAGLLTTLSTITGILAEPGDSPEWDLLTSPVSRLLHPEYSQGFRAMAGRAALLAEAREPDILQGETAWWCQQVDSTPKVKAAYYALHDLIDRCPSPALPEVARRLHGLAAHPDVDLSIRELAQLVLSGKSSPPPFSRRE